MRKIVFVVCFVVGSMVAAAPLIAQQKPPITPNDYGKWELLGPGTLSPDAKWLAYGVTRVNAMDELRIRNLVAATTKVAAFGSTPAFSDDSRWLAYSLGMHEEEQQKLEKAGKPVRNKMGILDLTTSETEVIEDVQSFFFSNNGPYLAIRRYPIEGKVEESEIKGVDLVVRNLATGADNNFGNISEFAWQDDGALLAMTIAAEDKVGNGVQLFDTETGMLRVLDSGDAIYSRLSWRENEDDLAVLRSKEDGAHEDETHIILAWTDLSNGQSGEHSGQQVEKLLYDPTADPNFPSDTRVVDFRQLTWADDGSALFFGIKEWVLKEPPPEEGTTQGNEEANDEETEELADVEVWHAKDVHVISEQKIFAGSDREKNFLAAWNLKSGRFVQLGNDLTEQVWLVKGGKVAIGLDRTPYDLDGMFGREYRDVYLIVVATGERARIMEQLRIATGGWSGFEEDLLDASPAGRYLLYVRDDHYWTYDLASGTHTNITAAVPTSFVDRQYDHPVQQKPPYGVAGWIKGDQSVLLYDEYDIWKVPPDGSKATKLTNGAEEEIRHRYVRLDPEEQSIDHHLMLKWFGHHLQAIDPMKPLYLSLYGESTKRFGYARLHLGSAPKQLVWLDKKVSRLSKAKDAEVYAYVIQDFDDSPDYFVGGPGLADAQQVTETNLFQREYAWGRSELIEYDNPRGDRLQAALFYPANYEQDKQYPMIVYIYEKLSDVVHDYTTPSEHMDMDELMGSRMSTVFSSRGYFVLQPDIVYQHRDPGLSAVECVVAAVEKVLETGMIDPSRIGLFGHSWGGYQTAFIVTQTDLFAAAAAAAPLTNLISMYGSILGYTGIPETGHFEVGIERMEVPFWKDTEAYTRNSPIFGIQNLNTPLLVVFGDKDGSVNWHQGIEMYNAARRARKEFVMLVYPGEHHSFRQKRNQIDFHRRILEWFGHYLQRTEAPKWITEGVTYLEYEKKHKRGEECGVPGRCRQRWDPY